MPTIAPRRSTGNAVVKIVRLSGSTIAPPSPCTVRAAISTDTFGANEAAAVAVAERGRGNDAGSEGDSVGIQGPLQRRQPDVQVRLHPRQGGGHDGGVERDHEVGRRGQDENPAEAAPVVCDHELLHSLLGTDPERAGNWAPRPVWSRCGVSTCDGGTDDGGMTW